MGAERLTGKGDMLFFSGADTIRVQCAYISTDEVNDACTEMAEEWSDSEQAFLPEAPKPAEPERVQIPKHVLLGACSVSEMVKYFL
jgi:DNA segregation ATPase FtsK/SpoIIIE-like protein